MQTSLQTSVSRLAVRSLISLCRMEGKPPLGQKSACSTENFLPQSQVEGARNGSQAGVHSYRRCHVKMGTPNLGPQSHRKSVIPVSNFEYCFIHMRMGTSAGRGTPKCSFHEIRAYTDIIILHKRVVR